MLFGLLQWFQRHNTIHYHESWKFCAGAEFLGYVIYGVLRPLWDTQGGTLIATNLGRSPTILFVFSNERNTSEENKISGGPWKRTGNRHRWRVWVSIGYPHPTSQADLIRTTAGICIAKILKFVSTGGLWGPYNGARMHVILLEVYWNNNTSDPQCWLPSKVEFRKNACPQEYFG